MISNRKMPESRPLDFVFDKTYTISTNKIFQKLAANASERTAEKTVQPFYGSMFSDVDRYPKQRLIYKIEQLPLSWEENSKSRASQYVNEITGRNQITHVFKPATQSLSKFQLDQFRSTRPSKIYINEIDGSKDADILKSKVSTSMRRTTRNKSTQTDYRDSETQTDTWIPPRTITDDFGLSEISFLKSECEMFAACDIQTSNDERTIRELREKLLSIDKRNLHVQIALTKQIQKIEWMTKEKRMDHVNNVRMELAQSSLYKHTVEMRISIGRREEYHKRNHDEWKNKKLRSLHDQKERQIRKLENKFVRRKWTECVGDPALW